MTFNAHQKVCLGFFLALVAFWATLFASGVTEGFYNYLFAFLYGLIPLVGGMFALIKGAPLWGGTANAIGKAIVFMGIGLIAWGIGETIWAYYNFFLGIEAPYPSAADIFFAPSVFFYALGAIYLAKTTGADMGLKNAFGKLLAVIAPVLVLLVTYYFLIVIGRGGQFFPEGNTMLKNILDLAYPIGDFVALSVSIIVSGLSFRYLSGGYRLDIFSILAGLAVMFVADSIFSHATTAGTSYNGDYGDLAFTVGVFLMTFGLLGFNRLKNPGEKMSC